MLVVQEEGAIVYVDKNAALMGGGVGQTLTWLTKRGGVVGEMLTLADKGD